MSDRNSSGTGRRAPAKPVQIGQATQTCPTRTGGRFDSQHLHRWLGTPAPAASCSAERETNLSASSSSALWCNKHSRVMFSVSGTLQTQSASVRANNLTACPSSQIGRHMRTGLGCHGRGMGTGFSPNCPSTPCRLWHLQLVQNGRSGSSRALPTFAVGCRSSLCGWFGGNRCEMGGEKSLLE